MSEETPTAITKSPGPLRQFGSAKGEFTVPDDFDDPQPELEDLFYNGPIFPQE